MIDPETNRRCSECDVLYPLTREFFYYSGNRPPEHRCKECIKKHNNDKERLYAYYNKNPIKERAKRILKQIFLTVKEDNLAFDEDITNEYIQELLIKNTHCECCNVKLDYTCYIKEGKNPNSPSVDKIFPKRGYVKTNLAILCWECNRIKKDSCLYELEVVYNWLSKAELDVRACVKY